MVYTTIKLKKETKEELDSLFPKNFSSEDKIKSLIRLVPLKVLEKMKEVKGRLGDTSGELFAGLIIEEFSKR